MAAAKQWLNQPCLLRDTGDITPTISQKVFVFISASDHQPPLEHNEVSDTHSDIPTKSCAPIWSAPPYIPQRPYLSGFPSLRSRRASSTGACRVSRAALRGSPRWESTASNESLPPDAAVGLPLCSPKMPLWRNSLQW